jgi:hypothetical protein
VKDTASRTDTVEISPEDVVEHSSVAKQPFWDAMDKHTVDEVEMHEWRHSDEDETSCGTSTCDGDVESVSDGDSVVSPRYDYGWFDWLELERVEQAGVQALPASKVEVMTAKASSLVGGGTGPNESKHRARRRFESEAQEPGGFQGTQGHQPVHQGAVCNQGEAGIQESDGEGDEKTEGDGQLKVALGSWR